MEWKISSNVVVDSNGEYKFWHKFLLTNTRVSGLRQTFSNGSSDNIKLSQTQFHKILQWGGFLGGLLGPLLKTGFPLRKNVLKQ